MGLKKRLLKAAAQMFCVTFRKYVFNLTGIAVYMCAYSDHECGCLLFRGKMLYVYGMAIYLRGGCPRLMIAAPFIFYVSWV